MTGAGVLGLVEATPEDLAQVVADAIGAFGEAACFEQAAQELVQRLFVTYQTSVVMARAYLTVPMRALPASSLAWVNDLARSNGIASDLDSETPVIALVGSAGRDPAWNDRRKSRGHVAIPMTSASFIDAIPMMSRLLATLGGDLRWIDTRDVDRMVSRLGTVAGTFYVAEAAEETDASGRKIISAVDFVREHAVRTVFGLGGAFATGQLLVVLVFCSVPVDRALVEAFQAPFLRFKAASARLLNQVFTDGAAIEPAREAGTRSVPARGVARTLGSAEDAELVAMRRELDALNAHYLDLEAQLENRTRALRLILNSTGDGLLLFDFDGRLVGEASAAIARWFAAPSPGMPVAELLFGAEPAQAAAFRDALAQMTSGQLPFLAAVARMPERLTRGEATLQLSYRQVFEGDRFSGVLVMVQDVTAAVAAERTRALALELLATTSRLKDEFLANMSHEIRTPLNGILGMAELLSATALDAEQRSFVATLLEACQGLRTVVDDVLDFSKIEAGKLSIDVREFELRAVLQGVVHMFLPVARRAQTELLSSVTEQMPVRVLGDPQRIRQVLMNLISNAVKFTRRGTVHVRVSLSADPRLPLRVEVADNGVGISQAARAQLFQPFVQADGSITRRFGGTGLGLTISRRLVELMGGRIGVESELGVGSTFWFELPVFPVSEATPPTPQPRSSAPLGGGYRILVGEDNPINQRVIAAMLRGLDVEADLVGDGKQVVERWRAGRYDAILMDCQMPEMSGFEAASVIRREERVGRVPIIAITAQAYAEDRERCERAGMDDHLPKPVTRDALQRILKTWLHGSRGAAGGAAPALVERTPYVDVVALDRLLVDLGAGAELLLEQLVEVFLAEFPSTLVQLKAAIEQQELPRVAREAHRLRSSTGNLAAASLSALCQRIELAAKGGDGASCGRLALELEQQFGPVSGVLRHYVAGVLRRQAASPAEPPAR